jgi:hypothetical protein
VNVVLTLDHPEGSVDDVVGALLKFLWGEVLQLLGYLLRQLSLSATLTLIPNSKFRFSTATRTASKLYETFLVLRMEIKL